MSCKVLEELEEVIRRRIEEGNPESYTYRLYSSGIPHIARKVGEEAVEAAVAAIAEGRERLAEEAADLLYHLLVLLNAAGLSLRDVCNVLEKRRK
ncbi:MULTISPECIES: phosphoribosyl-ATP diphosphatase [Pyrobaculum]|uniref:Phosphoribosyl-ATP pyrophosphatase n=2 Tax=Pyrobaculum arsenaticum TaxID=121277 RepID=HIS2_PYRAR|nr:phosphoribosyl-ATP diphosphatase [Pyrobaculum arsenaticum]A4WHB4.1 RecName: Full=Phosphoribosyl-ATP pyrophosphatase; Short=PRA-PH [Pyrobaculum arsenaticum DSM 13514]ABP49781.1 phosphoribosyl-ATP pyrophosphatase [Pyrobaculum arsenaticum DSM 13514]MCY0890784.1 phosphoribosyl-ATP diphosphatase [Pyrobaculum arsenaticum]NYR15767.1 phosphoribosyl-ATP diphosphatase [Pyrobaculum arsenaticum]